MKDKKSIRIGIKPIDFFEIDQWHPSLQRVDDCVAEYGANIALLYPHDNAPGGPTAVSLQPGWRRNVPGDTQHIAVLKMMIPFRDVVK